MISTPDLLREIRFSRQLTMGALADLAGVPTSTISRIEAGTTEPTLGMLRRLAEAAGFLLESSLVESGSDQALSDALDQLSRADRESRKRIIARLPAVSSVSSVAKRLGARRVEVAGDLTASIVTLQSQGQNPVVSSLEAMNGSVSPCQSFIPIVYVNDPGQVADFESANRNSYQVMFLLPLTRNVKKWTVETNGYAMVTPEWGLLDAMASPGRQADIARGIWYSMRKESKTRSHLGSQFLDNASESLRG